MKKFVLSLAAVLLFASAPFAQPKDSVDACREMNKKVGALIQEYRDLRIRRARLQPGEYDRDLNDYGGRLHEVLSSLGEELGHPPYLKKEIVDCLGKPDAVKNRKQMGGLLEIYNRELRKAGRKIEEKSNREYLIYFWRGGHDLLFFISEDGRIVDHGWWFAYE
jgi:hypothetical protein